MAYDQQPRKAGKLNVAIKAILFISGLTITMKMFNNWKPNSLLPSAFNKSKRRRFPIYFAVIWAMLVLAIGIYVCAVSFADSTKVKPYGMEVQKDDYLLWKSGNIYLAADKTDAERIISPRCGGNTRPWIHCSVVRTQWEDPEYSACAILDYQINPSIHDYGSDSYRVIVWGSVHTPNLCNNRYLYVSCFVMCSRAA